MEQIVNGLKCDTDGGRPGAGRHGGKPNTLSREEIFPSAKTAEKIGRAVQTSQTGPSRTPPSGAVRKWVTARISRSLWGGGQRLQRKNPKADAYGDLVSQGRPGGSNSGTPGPGYIEHPGGEEV